MPGPHSGQVPNSLLPPPGWPGRPAPQEGTEHVHPGHWPVEEFETAPRDPQAAVGLQHRPGARGCRARQGQTHTGKAEAEAEERAPDWESGCPGSALSGLGQDLSVAWVSVSSSAQWEGSLLGWRSSKPRTRIGVTPSFTRLPSPLPSATSQPPQQAETVTSPFHSGGN